MEKITEIDTSRMDYNAFDIIMRCKEFADSVDISNIILDNTSIDEKEFLIKLIEGVRSLELQVIEYDPLPQPEAEARVHILKVIVIQHQTLPLLSHI